MSAIIARLADEAADRERTPLMMSQKIVELLYKTNSPLGREVYVALLDQLCRSFEDVAKEAITWLLYAEDEVRIAIYTSDVLFLYRCSANSTCQLPLHCCEVVS